MCVCVCVCFGLERQLSDLQNTWDVCVALSLSFAIERLCCPLTGASQERRQDTSKRSLSPSAAGTSTCGQGHYLVGTICEPCACGRFQDLASHNETSCPPCPRGQFSANMGAAECTDCPAGQTSGVAACGCANCSAGKEAPVPGEEACSECFPGRCACVRACARACVVRKNIRASDLLYAQEFCAAAQTLRTSRH